MKHSWFVFLLFLASCSYLENSDTRAIARVGDDYLYESDLATLVAPGTSLTDSLNLVRNYIDSWVRRKVLIQQAMNNLTEEQLDFSRQLEDYRNSLIVYAYENNLVALRLDTIVTDGEIGNYYNENQRNFLLKDNIVRVSYLKIPVSSKEIRDIRRLFASTDPDDRDKLADICDKSDAGYFLDEETWLVFNHLLQEIPIQTYNQEEFLKYRRNIELQDSLYLYLVKFADFKIKEGISPLQFERERIRSIILNKRKLDLLNTMRQEIYRQALKQNEIEIF